MLISRVNPPARIASHTADDAPETTAGNRDASLSHAWWVLRNQMTEAAAKREFLDQIDCSVLDSSETGWEPSVLLVKSNGLLELSYATSPSEPYAKLSLSGTSLVGRVGKPVVQLTNESQRFVIACDAEHYPRLVSTLHAWCRIRGAGLSSKFWMPPVAPLQEPEGDILKCEVDALFTKSSVHTHWAPCLARLRRSGEFELFNPSNERIFSLQSRNISSYRIRHVDVSLVGSSLVLLLLPDMGGPESVYLRFAEVSDFDDWFSTLQALSQRPIASSLSRDPHTSVRYYQTLRLGISACRQDTAGAHESLKGTYVDLCVNHWISARTCVNLDDDTANWGQSFEIQNPEPAAQSGTVAKNDPRAPALLELQLRRRSSMVPSERDVIIGTAVVTEFDPAEKSQWISINPNLSVSVSVIATQTPVLDSSYYSEMRNWVTDLRFQAASRVIANGPSNATKTCGLFTDLYRAQGRQTEWILTLIDEEVAKLDPHSSTVFRGTSPLTRALETHLQQQGADLLQKTIGRFIRKLLIGADSSLELDPARVENEAEVLRNRITIGHYLNYLWSLIQAGGVPPTFRRVFSHLRKRITAYFDLPESELEKQINRALSAFIFLRFYSPALLNPQLFSLTDRILEPHHRRTTVLLAKILQGFANGVHFGAKESWLVPMNSFIDEHEAQLQSWYFSISQEADADLAMQRSLFPGESSSQISSLGDRIPKELPFEPFMRNQLSNPNLVDEWATYAVLANTVSEMAASNDRFRAAAETDEVVKGFTASCKGVLAQQNEILDSLTLVDSIEESMESVSVDLDFNQQTMLFGTNPEDLGPPLQPTVTDSSKANSVSSRFGRFAKDKLSNEPSDSGSKSMSFRKWTNVLRRSKH